MSYAEQKWTVDQMEKKIGETVNTSDVGKDLYLAGIPRGKSAKSISGNVYKTPSSYDKPSKLLTDVSGKGHIIGISAWVTGGAFGDIFSNTRVTIHNNDGDIVFTARGSFIYGANKAEAGNVSINPDLLIAIPVRGSGSGDTNSITNMAIPFDNGFKAEILTEASYSSAGTTNGRVIYVLDTESPPPSE